MSVSWLIACGIHAKMESDIQARLPTSWTMPTDIKLVQLTLDHLTMPYFIFLGGVSLAIIALVIETNYQRLQKFWSSDPKPVSKKSNRDEIDGIILPYPKHALTNVGDI